MFFLHHSHAQGQTTTKDAKELISIAADYQKRLREGDTTLMLPILAYYGTGRLWDFHRKKQISATRLIVPLYPSLSWLIGIRIRLPDSSI